MISCIGRCQYHDIIYRLVPDTSQFKTSTNNWLIDWLVNWLVGLRQEVHEDPVRPEPLPVEHLGRQQPAHLGHLLFGCFHHGEHHLQPPLYHRHHQEVNETKCIPVDSHIGDWEAPMDNHHHQHHHFCCYHPHENDGHIGDWETPMENHWRLCLQLPGNHSLLIINM